VNSPIPYEIRDTSINTDYTGSVEREIFNILMVMLQAMEFAESIRDKLLNLTCSVYLPHTENSLLSLDV
jgi:hypothetical protein